MVRLLTIVGLVLMLVSGCSQPVAPAAAVLPAQSLNCELFRHTVQGNGYDSCTTTLVRLRPDITERVSHLRCEQPKAGLKEDTSLQIDVSFARSRGGADVYNVNYQLTTGGRTAVREFEVRYTGEPVMAIDDEYGRFEFRPPVPR